MSDIWEHYRGIIAGATHPVVIEIGAADGGDTKKMLETLAQVGREFRMLAFECEPKNIPKMQALGLPKLEFFPVAVSDHCGTSRFVSSGSWPYSGSLKEPKLHRISHAWIPFQPPIEVPCVTLDSVMLGHGIDSVSFVWMDVQGAEDLVIAGGLKALAKTRYLYTEYYGSEEYTGQLNRDQIHQRLPGRWEITQDFQGDVLFHNLDFP